LFLQLTIKPMANSTNNTKLDAFFIMGFVLKSD